jgi:hypothetical protein
MSDTPILEALGLLKTEPAFQRAAQQVRRIAAQYGTLLAVWRDGRVVLIPPGAAVSLSTEAVPPTQPTR